MNSKIFKLNNFFKYCLICILLLLRKTKMISINEFYNLKTKADFANEILLDKPPKVLGKGAFSTVLKCLIKSNNTPAALKIL